MKMSDVRPGMRLRSTSLGAGEIEVVALTERGFTYRIPDAMPIPHPHWSMTMLRDGHEHFGVGGEAFYEVVVPDGGGGATNLTPSPPVSA